MPGSETRMICTCPACGRKAAVAESAREVVCDCGRRFDPAARPTVGDPFLGRDLSGYRVEEVIGSGGMGTVYRAKQLSLGRAVALKVLPPNVADDPHFVGRFHREAEILAQLSHPNVVQVIDRGVVDGRYFIVMEYVEGMNLRALVRRGRVPAKEACRIVAAVLEALDYAHRRGVVHRDIKPENVLIREDGIVKVADFGLSRFLGTDGIDTRLTRTHLVLGTYEYMAPEQRESSRDADSRADIYAAAVVLYEMLTGELPIGRFDLPSERVPGLDARLDAILERGLAKDPDRRFERASAMGRALGDIVTSPGAPLDLKQLKQASRVAPPPPDPLKPPAVYAGRLDVLLTVLSVTGIALGIAGTVLVFADEQVDAGLYELDNDFAGWIVGLFGLLLWGAAERARRFDPPARTALLTLTLLAAPTVIALPLVVWTWIVLAAPSMRDYFDARARELDEVDAAALAQGAPPPPKERLAPRVRRREAARANRTAAQGLLVLALGCWIAWLVSGAKMRDEGAFFFSMASILTPLGIWFEVLHQRVAAGAWIRFNGWLWSVLAPVAPRAARRARMLARDARDGLI